MPAYCAKGSGMGGRRPGGKAAEAGKARLPARRAGGLRPPARFLKKLGCYSNPCRFADV